MKKVAVVSYLYKNELRVGSLGLVDDIIGVTEVGFKAQIMNAFINLKTADKSCSLDQLSVNQCWWVKM